MGQLSITNVVNISVSQAQLGAKEYNTSNLAMFTSDTPLTGGVISDGYGVYKSPQDVATDFGSSSQTYQMALSVFSQQPNILANDGYLAIILLHGEEQSITYDQTPTAGSYRLQIGDFSLTVNSSASASDVQDDIRGLDASLSQIVVSSGSNLLDFLFYGLYSPANLSISSNTLTHSGSAVSATVAVVQPQETLGAAITRTEGLIPYFGILNEAATGTQMGSTDVLAAAAVIQAVNKIGLFVFTDSADLESDGIPAALAAGSFTQSRALYYGAADDPQVELAAYAGRALSTNFDGSNTTQTMHLKRLIGVAPDLSLTQTLLTKAITVGADTYPSLQGIPSVFCVGANDYFDDVYNLQWLVGALEIAGFNYLAQTSTKIPQTEAGIGGLKGAYRAVLQQAVANSYLAPGTWTSPDTFGNQADFYKNIESYGYYIYSTPIAQQSAEDRAARQAPLIQIAIKLAGAIQSSNVIVFVNP